VGGAYLCFEGAEKVFEAVFPHEAHAETQELEPVATDPAKLEADRVNGAVQTDFILSAEIMTIALGSLPEAMPFWEKAVVLGLVGIGITLLVYGAVALIVKADDIGLAMARHGRTSGGRAAGRGILVAMPWIMSALSVVGTAAMIWVGGGIVIHGLAEFGLPQLDHLIEGLAHSVGETLGPLGAELVTILADGIAGLLLGIVLIPIATRVLVPAWKAVRRLLPGGADIKPS
jgi:predicted DNA repair protein MutK